MTDSLLASFDKYFGAEFSQKRVFHYLDTLLLVYVESADSSESRGICILYNIFFLGTVYLKVRISHVGIFLQYSV